MFEKFLHEHYEYIDKRAKEEFMEGIENFDYEKAFEEMVQGKFPAPEYPCEIE